MKTTLYYFSATGNNLAVTKDLAKELHDNVEIIPITKLINEELIENDSDNVGIIFPVYLRDIPIIIEEFAKRLSVKRDTYVFAICTYHQDSFNSLFNLEAILKQKSINLSSGFRVNMPGTSVLVVDFTSTDEENKVRIMEEKKKIKEIAKTVKERKSFGIEGIFNKDEIYKSKNYLRNVYKVVNKFWVDNNCNLCGICTKVCPRNTVKIIDNKVVWDGICENCQACLHWCPMKAVQNGSNSINCRRYHHPEIELSDIIGSRSTSK